MRVTYSYLINNKELQNMWINVRQFLKVSETERCKLVAIEASNNARKLVR